VPARSPITAQGLLLKNARERMDVLAAYREAGSYRGAAEICGTTHKTVKRIVDRHNAGGGVPERGDRGHNYDEVRSAGD
jgi:transposase